VAARHITFLVHTSAFYPLIEQATPSELASLSSLRLVFLGGEPISMQRLGAWTDRRSATPRSSTPTPHGMYRHLAFIIREHDNSWTATFPWPPIPNARLG
jgi:non-ribosomal peptide synthetase component F